MYGSPSGIEKLYSVEHPQVVARFDDVALVEDSEDGYYISKSWLKGTD